MSERGVFAVDRGIWEHPSFEDEPFTQREAWAWLISEAAFRPHRRRIGSVTVDLERGQVACSMRYMAERWKWSEASVRRFLKKLQGLSPKVGRPRKSEKVGEKTDAMIVAQSDARITIITICNYAKYQKTALPRDADNDAPTDAATTQQRRKEESTKSTEEDKTSSLRSDVAREPEVDRPAKPKRSRSRSALPSLWQLDDEDFGYAARKGFAHARIREMAAAFANYHRSKGSLMADWHAAWRTWADNELKFRGTGPPTRPNRNQSFAEIAVQLRQDTEHEPVFEPSFDLGAGPVIDAEPIGGSRNEILAKCRSD